VTQEEYEQLNEEARIAALRARARRLFYFAPGAGEVDAKRKAAIKARDEMLALQKQAGVMREPELAKLFKQEAQESMKEYRGACLVLGHLAPGGDAPFVRTDEWPLELIPYAERVVA